MESLFIRVTDTAKAAPVVLPIATISRITPYDPNMSRRDDNQRANFSSGKTMLWYFTGASRSGPDEKDRVMTNHRPEERFIVIDETFDEVCTKLDELRVIA